jgi:hypothetical protein
MPTEPIGKTWTFQSDSNPDKKYETLLYVDGSTSCNCPGWTRKVDAKGNRSCKHTRLVHQNQADAQAISMFDYAKDDPKLKMRLDKSVDELTKAGVWAPVTGKRKIAI